MPPRTPLFRLLAIVALAASSASLADQTMDDATFCSFESGCETVTSSVYGKPLGIPLPIIGLVGFAAILGLTLVQRDSASRLARRLAIAGAIVGLALIVVQVAVLGRLCPLCLVADGCAIGLGVLAVKPFAVHPGSALVRAAWCIAAVLAVLLPLSLALADATADPPDWIQAQWIEGKVNVVEITDFECEHCRQADDYVREVLQTRSDVNFVRLPVPMPKHANSRTAAIAFEAAKAQGRGREMADALFAAKSLKPAECRKIAETLHLNMAEYDRVVSDPATDQEVTARSMAAKAAGPGVPLIWIQSHVIYGLPTIENFDGPFRRARPYRVK